MNRVAWGIKMAVKLRKPILVAGVGLSVVLWLWESLDKSAIEVGEWGIIGAIALGMGFWVIQQSASKEQPIPSYLLPLKRETVEAAIAEGEAMLTLLEIEAPNRDISQLKQQLSQLPKLFHRDSLQIAITGAKKVGKTSLKKILETGNLFEQINFLETESLLTEIEGEDNLAKELALAADLVIFITSGDLTDSEGKIIQELRNSHQRLILLFNKQDRYLPEERTLILGQLGQRVGEMINFEDVIPISSEPKPIKVRQHQADGSWQEWWEQPKVDISLLTHRLAQILNQEREQLVLATVWREASKLKKNAKQILNEVRRNRALPVIEQYQWIAAAAAFANPVAALDLVAAAAINAQMLVDLSEIYQQKFSLSQAQIAAGNLGKLMVKLGLVELSTQMFGTLLKSQAVTYVAGGVLQGISSAYLTRLAGLSLIEYFQEQEVALASGEGLNWEKLGQKLKQVFEQNKRTVILQNFIKQGSARLNTISP